MSIPKRHKQFVAAIGNLADPAVVGNVSRFFRAAPKAHSSDNQILGVSIGKVLPVAKQFADMPLADIERLLDSPCYEVRMGRSRAGAESGGLVATRGWQEGSAEASEFPEDICGVNATDDASIRRGEA